MDSLSVYGGIKSRFLLVFQATSCNELSWKREDGRAQSNMRGNPRQRYPKLNFIFEKNSNNAFLQLSPASASTMHRIVVHEMAWSGVPVVTCGDRPHIGFDFNHNAKTEQQLKALIQRADRLRMRISRKQISEYLFMHCFSQQRQGLFVANLISQPPFTTKESSPTSILNQVLTMQKETRQKELGALKRKIALSGKLDNPLRCFSKKQR